jgi:hypothetical protein
MNYAKGWYVVFFVLILIGGGSCGVHSERDSQPDPTSTIFIRPIRELPTVLPPGDAWLAIPPPVQDAHRTSTLLITWHEQPYPGYYDAINLCNDGRLQHWVVVEDRSVHQSYPAGQLTQQEIAEVQGLLKKLATMDVMVYDNDAAIVSLSFIWDGEPHYTVLDQFHCAGETIQVFEIINAAFSRHPDISSISLNPCRALAGTEDTVTPDPISLAVNFTFSDLPQAVQRFHQGLPLFKVVWFQKPFDDSYHQLTVFDDHEIMYRYRLSDEQSYHRVLKGQLTDPQMQRLRHILIRMNTEGSHEDTSALTAISFGYSWRGDYRLRLFAETDCPDDLKWIFAAAKETLGVNELDLDINTWPCQD